MSVKIGVHDYVVPYIKTECPTCGETEICSFEQDSCIDILEYSTCPYCGESLLRDNDPEERQ